MRKTYFIIVLLLTGMFVSGSGLLPWKSSKDKLIFYTDTLEMKNEILRHVPIGTSVDVAKTIMQKNKMKCTFVENGDYGVGQVMFRGIDFLWCDRSKSAGFMVSQRWQFALVHEQNKITQVWVTYGLIGP